MQTLSHLQHFQLVAQEGSFARAADLANISQPALSNSIKALEERLGFKLFERSERPIKLTPLGKSIVEHVDAVLFEARNLEQLIGNLSKGESGHLRVGMTAVFSTAFGGPILAAWSKTHPNVKLDLIAGDTRELTSGLNDETFDLIVGDTRGLRDVSDGFDLKSLPPQKGGVFCRAGHPILSIAKPQGADLARYPFAGTHFSEAVIHALKRFLEDADPPSAPGIAIDSNNIAALRDAVVESDLILLTTPGTVRNALELGTIKQIPIDLGIDGEWSIATRRGRILHPAAPRLIAQIAETAAR